MVNPKSGSSLHVTGGILYLGEHYNAKADEYSWAKQKNKRCHSHEFRSIESKKAFFLQEHDASAIDHTYSPIKLVERIHTNDG